MSSAIQSIIDEIIIKSRHGEPLYKERLKRRVRGDRIEFYREAIRVFKRIRSSRFKQSTIFDF